MNWQEMPPPSWFSAQGMPKCSKWFKLEIEILAWAYVTGLARNGDTWEPVSAEQCWLSLTKEERQLADPWLHWLAFGGPSYWDSAAEWWEVVTEQLKDAHGAVGVASAWAIPF